MKQPLRGAHALITGAASGIGRQLARDLCTREGCAVRLVDRDEEGVRALATELGPAASAHRVDVASREDIATLDAAIGDDPLDILVNCAGILSVGPFEKMRAQDFERVVEVNLLGTMRMTHALLPRLLRSSRGAVVNVASAAGLVAAPSMSAYSASKFAVVGFSQALRSELRRRVSVSTICPTLVHTNIVRSASFSDGPAGTKGSMEGILARMGASPEKVSRAIVRAIVKKRGLVLVNLDAHALYHLGRLCPGLTSFAVRKMYRHLQRKGILGE